MDGDKEFQITLKQASFSKQVIPQSLVKRITTTEKCSTRAAILMNSSGYSWHVDVYEDEKGDLYFGGDIWLDFLSCNNLKDGDLLSFLYKGKMTFSFKAYVRSPDYMALDYVFKLLVIGDSGVGKSSLLLRFLSENSANPTPTVGMDIKFKMVTVQGKRLKLEIHDTAGQERFNALTSSYYRGAQGIIMVYDVTRRATFGNLEKWLEEIKQKLNDQVFIKMIVGNKADFKQVRDVTEKEGKDFARSVGWLFKECSAKTGENVEDCFMELASKIMEHPSLLAQIVLKTINLNKESESAEKAAAASSCRLLNRLVFWRGGE